MPKVSHLVSKRTQDSKSGLLDFRAQAHYHHAHGAMVQGESQVFRKLNGHSKELLVLLYPAVANLMNSLDGIFSITVEVKSRKEYGYPLC